MIIHGSIDLSICELIDYNMDTSERYITMCQKAYDLHDLWHPQNGDFFYEPNGRNHPEFCVSVWSSGSKQCENTKNKTWLPRQDQLQKMVVVGNLHDMGYAVRRVDWNAVDDYWVQLKSLEQFWLSYAMVDLYNKLWNGTEWTGE